MQQLTLVALSLFMLGFAVPASAKTPAKPTPTLQCAGFSPYVGTLNPDYGPAPSPALIGQLLDQLIKQTPYRCIMTYGVLNGLEAIFPIAKAKKLQVIAIIWLDNDPAANSRSIAKGIETAKAFPETIIKLSCGSELRTRHGFTYDGEISRCIQSLKAAGVRQPITTIDTWWEWCNRSASCTQNSFAKQVDWLGINIYPWWENKYSDRFSCTPADKAADFHIARLDELRRAYPQKDITITEFGWPNAPKNATATNIKTGQRCGIASAKNQALVVRSTFKKLAKKHTSGVVFEAFSENWKTTKEGEVGSAWGICSGQPPYACNKNLK